LLRVLWPLVCGAAAFSVSLGAENILMFRRRRLSRIGKEWNEED
jgi:hypothetical protein